MKTNIALIVAIGMGLAGGMLNLLYLNQAASEAESISFLGIKPGLTIRRGDTFKEDHFVKVNIPKNAVGNLNVFAEPWANLINVKDTKATRNFAGGELVLHEDLKTPPMELKEGPNERTLWVPVDTRQFVPSQIDPGDWVSFMIPITALAPPGATAPTPPKEKDTDEDLDVGPSAQTLAIQTGVETIGPFRVLAVGTRKGSYEVWKSQNLPIQQENVLTVAVKAEGGQLDPNARKLWKLLQQSASRQAGVLKLKAGEKPT